MLFYYYDYILIQNYQKIIKIEENLSIVLMKHYSFEIEGECLKITYFSKEELKIEGNIRNIKINYAQQN